MTTETQGTVRTHVVVEAAVERAFAVFTEQFDKIKPRDHNMLGVDIAESVFEPRAGGRIYDRGVDGTECQWGRVLAYEAPDRIVFSWDISPQWQLESDLDKASEVELHFIARRPRAHSRRTRAPEPRAPWRGLGRAPRGCRRRRWLAALPAEICRRRG